MKKFIFGSALLIVLMCTFNTIDVHATEYVTVFNYDNYCAMGCTQSALDNTELFWPTYPSSSQAIKPFIYAERGSDYIGEFYVMYLECKPPLKGEENGSVRESQYFSISVNLPNNGHNFDLGKIVTLKVPIFYDFNEGCKWSRGEAFNSNTALAMPYENPSIGSDYYENHIYHFEKVWNVYSRPNTRMSWNIAWLQPYGNDLYESSDYHRQIGITLRYPDYTSIANLYDSVFNEPQSFSTTLEYAKSFFNYDNLYDSRLTYKTTTVWIDIDDMINDYEANGENSEWANWFHLTQNTDKNEYNFTMYETLETAFTANNWGQSYSYNPKGIINILRQYYNNDRLLLFALPFCIFDKAQMFTFNEPLNIVYNPIYIFWFDATAPDGTRSEKRNFGSPTDISSDNLVEPDSTNGNVGVENGVPNPTQEQLNSNYNNSIQDSYNTIYNNYYYTSQENKELLDYLLKYKNGGTQEEIQDAFGYVNSTVDSVSNVPVLLGKLFTGFFPPFVVKLFSAMFIIFGVFIVIKIIRHLFL